MRQRELVKGKLEGMSDDVARSVVTSSGMRIHGIVAHLRDVERSWLRRWFAGERGLPVVGTDEYHVVEPRDFGDVGLTDLLAAYAEESRCCDKVVAVSRLGDVAANAPASLLWILHHLVEETARHLGHLDVLCELVDGRTGDVLTLTG